MKKIKTYEDLKNEFKKYKIIPRNTLRTRGYVNRIFECGCGKLHDVNEVKILMCALLVRFVFKCTKNISSMVKVSGFFKKKCTTEWFCKSKLVEKFIKETNYYDLT